MTHVSSTFVSLAVLLPQQERRRYAEELDSELQNITALGWISSGQGK